MDIEFSNKVAIVTGAGQGLGRSYAIELAKRGAKVLVNDLADAGSEVSESAQRVVAEIESLGGEVMINSCSVSDPEGAQAIAQDAMERWGKIDILINNAGILRSKTFAKVDLNEFRQLVDVHLWGTVQVSQAVWGHMRDSQYGRIVMTSSPTGLFGNFAQSAYGAAKLGIVGFANSLRLEGEKYNIRVNTIAPVAHTQMTEALMGDEMKQAMAPELVAAAVVYLCSDQAPNGSIVQAAGGHFSRAMIMENSGIDLGLQASVEDVAANIETILAVDGLKLRDSAVS